jgi:hypothetical protein
MVTAARGVRDLLLDAPRRRERFDVPLLAHAPRDGLVGPLARHEMPAQLGATRQARAFPSRRSGTRCRDPDRGAGCAHPARARPSRDPRAPRRRRSGRAPCAEDERLPEVVARRDQDLGTGHEQLEHRVLLRREPEPQDVGEVRGRIGRVATTCDGITPSLRHGALPLERRPERLETAERDRLPIFRQTENPRTQLGTGDWTRRGERGHCVTPGQRSRRPDSRSRRRDPGHRRSCHSTRSGPSGRARQPTAPVSSRGYARARRAGWRAR